MEPLCVFWMFYMLKKIVLLSTLLACHGLIAAKPVELYKAPVSSLKKFLPDPKLKNIARSAVTSPENNSLLQVNQSQEGNVAVTRYQQMYKGIPVVGAQVMIVKASNKGLVAKNSEVVNGHLIDEVQINTIPSLNPQQAIDLAKKGYFSTHPISSVNSELQIRTGLNNELKLVYLVSFKGMQANKPVWPFYIVDAHTGAILKQWNNIKTYLDSGPGGNEKVHEYWYGKDDLPALNVTQKGTQCIMDTANVKLVNLKTKWDWEDKIMTPFQYPCNKNTEETVNGGFSPSNDAYYFGHTIVGMYKDWYGVNALQNAKGVPMKLVMRVHFGQSYDNAFWDGQAMSFGDGEDFYPLVSLDVAGHEVTHGFTEQHSGLEYQDQSGALNESLSDMAGQASRAYLLETNHKLYGKAYQNPDEVTWGIGETITRDAFGKALRFMDFPSSDGSSADCLDKSLAQSNGAYCAISYAELIAFAKSNVPEGDRQSYIVHTASGVYNKAFYLLSQEIGIKKAYHVMLIANSRYWTPTTNFNTGACGALKSAKDLAVDINLMKRVFGQVGIATSSCAV